MSHPDKHGKPLEIGDTVELVYAGDHHRARITSFEKHPAGDTVYANLQIHTRAQIPCGHLTFVSRHREPDEENKPTTTTTSTTAHRSSAGPQFRPGSSKSKR